MSDGPATLTVTGSEVFHNGAGDGFSHNFYVQGESIVLIGNHIHDSKGGQNVKVRSHDALIAYNLIENAGNYEIDLIQNPSQTDAPNANAILIGNVDRPAAQRRQQQPGHPLGDGQSRGPGRNGSLFALSNTFILAHPSNRLFHAISPALGSKIHLVNSIVHATVSGTGLAADATTAAILVGSNDWISSNVTTAGALIGPHRHRSRLRQRDGPPPHSGLAGDGRGSLRRDRGGRHGGHRERAPGPGVLPPLGTARQLPRSALDLGAFGFSSASDAGTADAGPGDAGVDAGGGTAPPGDGSLQDVTGSCSTTASGAPALWLAIVMVLAARRRSVNS